ncbi:DUF6265 family protein [Arenibacter sp. M-2]|uniref:DUF6265 family protein n=1 Tax=Arenibacter sp. M-2 TaxID=3053612 RepID=UPI00257050A0|nr:DUF6265 family protein [Arenibacter sp. M-2]MDL5514118.1 DUF6265 family protein [Arenibacter sp. M-2]|tara:strand:- start:1834 stop:2322 length:489 start_codon:yes stop_codon:yes gene_type:complete
MKWTLILLLTAYLPSFGQNTISYTDGNPSPNATLSDVSWIAGHWKGEAFGGITEEIWSPPLGDSMMFVFKLVVDDKVALYEVGHIRQEEESLILRLKHFNGNLTGWEEKDKTVDFKLVKIEGNKVYFDDFTFEKINDSEINIYVVLEQKNGSKEEVAFNYKK